jgi:hypothetical protein
MFQYHCAMSNMTLHLPCKIYLIITILLDVLPCSAVYFWTLKSFGMWSYVVGRVDGNSSHQWQGVTFHQTSLFSSTAIRTSNLTRYIKGAVHKTSTTAPHDYKQHNQTTPHEVLKQPYYICILTMGIMMPETCWYISRNIYFHHCCIRWFSLNTSINDAWSRTLKTYTVICTRLRIHAFWDVILCHGTRGSWHFKGSWHFYLQGLSSPVPVYCLTLEDEAAIILWNIRTHSMIQSYMPNYLNSQQHNCNNLKPHILWDYLKTHPRRQ